MSSGNFGGYNMGGTDDDPNAPRLYAPPTIAANGGGRGAPLSAGVGPWGGGSGGGGSIPQSQGMGGNILQNLIQSLQTQQQASNSQNLKQYNNLLGTVNATKQRVNGIYGQENGLLSNAGQAEHSLLNLNTQNQIGQNNQDLVSRGLDNTTIRSSSDAGIQRNAGIQGQMIDQNVNQQKLGLLGQQAQGQMQLGQMGGDAILSRQNQQPDLSSYLGLIGQLGKTSGATGGMSPGVYINGRKAGTGFGATFG